MKSPTVFRFLSHPFFYFSWAKPILKPVVQTSNYSRRRMARYILAILLAGMQVFAPLPTQLLAIDKDESLAATAVSPTTSRTVKVNRTAPTVAPAFGRPVFSANPTDAEIARARVFGEPLLKTEESPADAKRSSLANISSVFDRLVTGRPRSHLRENRALAKALLAYAKTAEAEDVSPVADFLKQFPHSRWRACLLINLGIVYRRTGYFTRALGAFEEAWKLTKDGSGKNTRAMANWAVGELAAMHAHLGHAERLEALFAELGHRDLHGPTTERIAGAKESLWLWRHQPEESFRCGLMALASIQAYLKLPNAYDPRILSARATPHGMSLAQVAELADQLKMGYQIARREPGAKILFPAVVHWKVDHFSAIVDRIEDGGKESYLVENPLFEQRIWVSRAVLDEETSGYYLVPPRPLPSGWRPVGLAEAANVWGKCYTGRGDDTQTMSYAKKVCEPPCCPDGTAQNNSPSGMAQYNFHAMLVSLNIVDEPLGYTPPRGPSVRFIATYNQREAYQPAIFSFSNLGPKWTFDWLSYVSNPGARIVTVYLRGGGLESYDLLSGQSYYPFFYEINYQSHAQLVLVSQDRNSFVYERRLPDGSKEVFSQSDGSNRRVFLTQIVDPAGNAVRLTYDANMRVIAVTDALGQVTTLAYELPNDPLKITRVTDPFDRSAMLTYNAQGQLTKITDVIGLTSEFTYDTNDFINSMTTPYGTTRFRTGVGAVNNDATTRWVEATDPLGDTERLEFRHRAPGLPVNHPEDLYYRNSFYWDKRAWKEAPGDYLKARRFHWLALIAGVHSGVLQDEQRPLESRIKYKYLDQAGITFAGTSALPTEITRELDDGSAQTYRYQYNDRGNVTESVDPAGRKFSFVYDTNEIDLLEVRSSNTNELLAQFAYNSQHLPLIYTDAGGQTTTFTYNAQGQVTSVTNAKGEKTTFTYDEDGYLINVTGPVTDAVTSFSYDGFGRLHTITDSEGYQVAIEYDALDRPTRIIYPDQTFERFTYDRLDLTQISDRLGRITQIGYDALRRPLSVTDPMERMTNLVWCDCGGLSQLIDAAGNITTWNRDLQGRVTSKVLADGTKTRHVYENSTSRLKQTIDAKGQITHYAYAIDDNLAQISFTHAEIPTPSVTFTYDPNYDRLVSVQDGTGTTTYSYHPVETFGALQVAAVDGPLDNDTITYTYDELGRVVSRSINGVASSRIYDALGRVTSETNPMGTFTATYVRVTDRLNTLRYPNGQSATFDYFDNTGDQRLKQIKHQTSDLSLLSQFDYTYAATGEILSLTRQLPGLSPALSVYNFSYDPALQLTGAVLRNGNADLASYAYDYDQAGNRTREQINSVVNAASFNNTNQLVTLRQGDAVRQFTYDANGNLTSDGIRRYEWDALDRLTAIVMGNHRTEFSYDALGRRTRIIEKENNVIVSDKRLIWCGDAICEERRVTESGSAVTKRFFLQGETEVVGGVDIPYFYTKDHLGNIREMTDRNGDVVAQYEYDPYGRMTKMSGAKDASFGYAGYYVHAPSGLNLTWFRAYDPNLGRWLSRDPIEEMGGMNLYGYVGNNPVNLIDSSGLDNPAKVWAIQEAGKRVAEEGQKSIDQQILDLQIRYANERLKIEKYIRPGPSQEKKLRELTEKYNTQYRTLDTIRKISILGGLGIAVGDLIDKTTTGFGREVTINVGKDVAGEAQRRIRQAKEEAKKCNLLEKLGYQQPQ